MIFYSVRKTLKKIIKSKKGMTLVELVVTFALMALFAMSTTQLLSVAIKTYHQLRGLNDARQVSDTLLEKITGEIEGAQTSLEQTETSTDSSASIHIYGGGEVIQLRDRTGSKIAITASDSAGEITGRTVETTYADNQLLIYYYQLNNDSGNVRYEAVDWTYDSPADLGFQIDKLTFSQADPTGVEYPQNVIKVVLTVKSDQYGSFTAIRYVECYNYVTDQDFEKIKDDSSGSGGGGETGGGDDGSGSSKPTTAGAVVITLPDSLKNEHSLKNSLDWETVKSKIGGSGWNVESGSILTDSTGTYICYNWSQWVWIKDGSDFTLADLVLKYPGSFKKIDNTSVLIAEDRTVLDNNRGTIWDPLPEKGTICYYGGSYYIAPTEIGQYTMPPDGWIKIVNN
ncbi:MAG: prepilin-type N-terminal cleavage/methylation domain-containing protein [Hespellia sp.]|nr:prepilin-type N-terminal cleavage/methylation domain-containing protein [Hespellia sp.]